jgi:hypothetical protein
MGTVRAVIDSVCVNHSDAMAASVHSSHSETRKGGVDVRLANCIQEGVPRR